MKLAIAHRFATIARSLPGPTLWQLRRAVPPFLMRTRGLDNPEILYWHAREVAKTAAPRAGAADLDAMAFYLIGVAGIAESESRAKPRAKLGRLSEMGEMETLRLQRALDRMSKFMTTLSNLLKKQSDTASAITQNLK